MIRDDLAHQRQTKAGAVFAARDKRFKDIFADIVWQARPIIGNLDLERQCT